MNKNQKYWRDREAEAEKHYIAEEEKYNAEIRKKLGHMINQCNKEIANFYSKYATDEGITMAEAKRRVTKLDIEEYEAKAKKYVETRDFSDQANEEMKLYNLTMKVNRLELLKANLGLEVVDTFDDLQKYYDDKLTKRTLDEFERLAGILGKSVVDNAKNAKSIVNASFYNATFSDRLWGHSTIFRAELEKLITTGLIQGKSSRELARQLRKSVESTVSASETLMRTEMSRVRNDAQLKSIEENGFDEYEYLADPNEMLAHKCSWCRRLDRTHHKLSRAKVGINMPPMHPNCRCTITPWMDDELYEEWLDGYSEHHMDFNAWKKQKSRMFFTKDDPMRDVMGSGFDSHPEEVNKIIESIKAKNVEIEYRPNAMGYMPNPTSGIGGKVVMEKDASYSAWLHESQHVNDDEASGWQGFRLFMDPQKAAEIEARGYDVEIELAKKLGYNEVVTKLEKLKAESVAEILGK